MFTKDFNNPYKFHAESFALSAFLCIFAPVAERIRSAEGALCGKAERV
jgi:hypothetical protein